MCGRYTFTQLPAQETIAQSVELPLEPRYNMAPSQAGLVRPSDDPQRYHVFRWGLIPHWAQDHKIGYKMINARLETVLEKPAFRQPIRKQRVLVWADGFYEWKKSGKDKQPYRIVVGEGVPFHFAGIADRWRNPEGEWIDSYTILTTEPNELMADLHHRMPVILGPEEADAWLDPATDIESLLPSLRPYPAEQMRAYPVDPRVGNVRHESPELIAPLGSSGTLF